MVIITYGYFSHQTQISVVSVLPVVEVFTLRFADKISS